jgi:hypothetical protein
VEVDEQENVQHEHEENWPSPQRKKKLGNARRWRGLGQGAQHYIGHPKITHRPKEKKKKQLTR